MNPDLALRLAAPSSTHDNGWNEHSTTLPRAREQVTPDPKPIKRIQKTSAGREKMRREGCRLCTSPFFRDPRGSRHHLVPRSLGGDDVEDNLVPLCGSGTTGCHGLVEAHDKPTLSRLRAALSESELAYVISKKGADFLDRYYPADKLYERSTG